MQRGRFGKRTLPYVEKCGERLNMLDIIVDPPQPAFLAFSPIITVSAPLRPRYRSCFVRRYKDGQLRETYLSYVRETRRTYR